MDADTFEIMESRGLGIALFLLIVTGLLLPRGDRKLLLSSAVTLLLSAICLVPWHVSLLDWLRVPTFENAALFFLLISISRTGLLLLVAARPHRVLFANTPKIFLDLGQVFAFVVVILITLRVAGVQASSLVASSAVLTAAIGFVMKDTLGNIFSGLAIQIERPFVIGDWIQFDQDKSRIGKVLEINWRATKVLTLDEAVVLIPNGTLAQAAIVIFTQPTPVTRRSIYFTAPYHIPPQDVHRIVMEAISDMPRVVKQPAPSIVTLDFTERGTQYWLRIFTTDIHLRDRVDGEARDRIWYALQRHGISSPPLQHHMQLEKIESPRIEHRHERRLNACRRALRSVDFFRSLPESAFEQLAAHAKRKMFAAGECLMREGDQGTQLYVLASGSIRITKKTPSGEAIEIDQVHVPGFVGEMSLLTGAPRSATVSAIEPTKCFMVDREALWSVLKNSPELMASISDVIGARHQNQASSIAAADQPASNAEKNDLLDRIRDFFRPRK